MAWMNAQIRKVKKSKSQQGGSVRQSSFFSPLGLRIEYGGTAPVRDYCVVGGGTSSLDAQDHKVGLLIRHRLGKRGLRMPPIPLKKKKKFVWPGRPPGKS